MRRSKLNGYAVPVVAVCIGISCFAREGSVWADGATWTMPYNAGSSCATSGSCIFINNMSTGVVISAVNGDPSSPSIVATNEDGGNGIVANNFRTDLAAAVISAVAGGDTGLAYWGTGSMELTGGISIGGTHTINPGEAWKPGGGSWSASSDIRVKKDVTPFAAGLSELTRVRPVTYRYNGLGGTVDDGKQYVGVIGECPGRC